MTNGSSQKCFPGGRRLALSMSFDDGSEHDRRLVDMFNRHGIRGAFHLNSTTLGQDYRVGRNEIRTLYRDHEISCHGATHADLTRLSDDDVRRELSEDKNALEDLCGEPVRGLAYAYGCHDGRVKALSTEIGFIYGRTAGETRGFTMPDDPLALTSTCHHSAAMDLGRHLLDSDAPTLQWMLVFGHSYELDGFMTRDPSKDWAYMEAFCDMMGERDDIWYATISEVLEDMTTIVPPTSR